VNARRRSEIKSSTAQISMWHVLQLTFKCPLLRHFVANCVRDRIKEYCLQKYSLRLRTLLPEADPALRIPCRCGAGSKVL
jgi:hypothetical protein